MFEADRAGIKMQEPDWALMVHLMKFLESNWQKPDEGIWEVRGGRKNFTHSKMMAWVAFDCAVKLVEECGCAGDEHHDRWRKVREQIHAEVCERGYNPKKKGVHPVLRFRCAGRQPANDAARWFSACNRRTCPQYRRGHRKRADARWLGVALSAAGMRRGRITGARRCFSPMFLLVGWLLAPPRSKKEARELFERLLDVRNDLGLLSEEYDPREKRQLGNFPQAFSHVALLGAARILDDEQETATSR